MKKALMYSILIFIILIIIKYGFSNYTISYKLNNYEIKEVYKNKRFYYEIKDENNLVYNFDIYSKRKFFKTKISKIKVIEDETFKCIYPTIKGQNTYPLCYSNNEYTDFNLIDSPLLLEYKQESINVEKAEKDFIYTIYMANNDEEHEYTSLVTLNLTNLNKGKIDLGYTLDFDSYIVGNIKNNLYIFDNKYSILYEINTKNKKVKIIANNEKGYVKYENGEFVSCSKNEYKVNKIKFNTNTSKYKYTLNNGTYKTINENKNLLQKINNNDINIIKEKDNKIYYNFEDNFYIYEPSNNNLIFYNYELTFNSNNTMFVYIK